MLFVLLVIRLMTKGIIFKRDYSGLIAVVGVFQKLYMTFLLEIDVALIVGRLNFVLHKSKSIRSNHETSGLGLQKCQ